MAAGAALIRINIRQQPRSPRIVEGMARYHFHIHNGVGDLTDEEGSDFADLDQAREHAVRSIRSLLSHEVLDGRIDLSGSLDIADSAGTVVTSVAFSDAVVLTGQGGWSASQASPSRITSD